jgi:PAS domain S-box-containing protein
MMPLAMDHGGFVKIFHDRTAEHEAEAASLERERELRFALKAGRFGAWRLDIPSGELTSSETCRANFGRDPDADFSYAELRDAVHPDDRARMQAAVAHSIATATDYDIEYRAITPSGEERWVQIRAQPSYAPGGAPLGMAGISLDITDRRAAEDRLRELNDTLEAEVSERTAELRFHRDIIEATRSPICAFDRDYRVIAFNKAHGDFFDRIFAHRVQIGEVFPDLFSPDQAPTIRALMARALAGERYTVVEEFGDPDRAKPYWEVTFTPLLDEAGEVVGAFLLANDITDRLCAEAELKNTQQALRQAQKMEAMGQLTGGVAHDFNNLLTPIVGTLDLLQRKGIGAEREQRLVAAAMQSAERARTLVQRLLAFARRQPLQAVPVDIAQLVMGMGELVASTTGPQIRVVAAADAALPPALADPNQLEMALLNLSVNARDAMPGGGTLRIAARAEHVDEKTANGLERGEYICLSVSDDGTGMDEATLARAVEPFFSTKGIGQGTGLGLSMVHGLASQLGGALVIHSRVGVGTDIELWLPQSANAPATPAASAYEPAVAPLSGRVLLVDDEELVRLSTADMLVDLGYEVAEASSAEQALRLIDDGMVVDLLVTDHLMPGMTGVELAREVRRRHPATPILLVSGFAEVAGLDPALPRLIKPFRKDELAASVDRVARQDRSPAS